MIKFILIMVAVYFISLIICHIFDRLAVNFIDDYYEKKLVNNKTMAEITDQCMKYPIVNTIIASLIVYFAVKLFVGIQLTNYKTHKRIRKLAKSFGCRNFEEVKYKISKGEINGAAVLEALMLEKTKALKELHEKSQPKKKVS